MSIQPGNCRSCRLNAIADDADEEVLVALQDNRSLQAIVRELVALRATHSCELEANLAACNKQNDLLAQENRRLQETIDALEEANKRLQEELMEEKIRANAEIDVERDKARCLAQMLGLTETSEIDDLVNRVSHPRELDGEILNRIIGFLAPPAGIFDYTLTYGRHSAWLYMMRTLNAVSQVCKQWHAATIPLLYRDVVLRRVGQVVAFACAVRSQPHTLAYHVRSLTLYCFVPDTWVPVVRQSLAHIEKSCTNVQALSVQGPFPAANILLPTDFPAKAPLLQRLTCLSAFDAAHYGPELNVHAAFLPAGTYAKLTSLSLFVSQDVNRSWQASVQFPNLEILILGMHNSSSYPKFRLPERWDLPHLKDLRFRLHCGGEEGMTPFNFIEKYSSTLKSLEFGAVAMSPQLRYDAAALCAHLEHLIIAISDAEAELTVNELRNSALFTKPIELVDLIVYRARQYTASEKHFSGAAGLTGCAWKNTRYLGGHLVDQVPNLPYLFPGPNANRDYPRIMQFYGIRIKETNDSLGFADGWEQLQVFPLPESDSDDESEVSYETEPEKYIFTDESDDEDEYYMGRKDLKYRPGPRPRSIQYNTDEGETDEGRSLRPLEEEGFVTEEEALAMFERSLNIE